MLPVPVEFDPKVHCGVVDDLDMDQTHVETGSASTFRKPCTNNLNCSLKGHNLAAKQKVARPLELEELKRLQKESYGPKMLLPPNNHPHPDHDSPNKASNGHNNNNRHLRFPKQVKSIL